MAAAKLPGITVIKMASANYMVQDLCFYLQKLGVRIEGVGKTFNRNGKPSVEALRGIDLSIREGEFVSIVGPSGSGKSTLLGTIAGVVPAMGGTVLVDGRDELARAEGDLGHPGAGEATGRVARPRCRARPQARRTRTPQTRRIIL